MKKAQAVQFWKALEASTQVKLVINSFKNKAGWTKERTLRRYADAHRAFKSRETTQAASVITQWNELFITKIRIWWEDEFAGERQGHGDAAAEQVPTGGAVYSGTDVNRRGAPDGGGLIATIWKKFFARSSNTPEPEIAGRVRSRVTESQRLAALDMAVEDMAVDHGHVDWIGLIESYLTGSTFTDYPCSRCGGARFRPLRTSGAAAHGQPAQERDRNGRRIREEVSEKKRLAYLQIAQEDMIFGHSHVDWQGLNESYMTGRLFTEDSCTICGHPRFQDGEVITSSGEGCASV